MSEKQRSSHSESYRMDQAVATEVSKKFLSKPILQKVKNSWTRELIFQPPETILFSHCKNQNLGKDDIAGFELVRLTGLGLQQPGNIGVCRNLVVCLLARNFFSDISALEGCRHLVRLDVHSNQILDLPGSSFWETLEKLQLLNLHDNPLGKLEAIESLRSSPSLAVLTLYDTPLSLRQHYRHHVVNSIWTLKALDQFVISDQEIIEDAVFTKDKFSALSPGLRIDLCPPTSSNLSCSQELGVVRALIARVNSILAKNSPVHIVQRCIRGFLVRKKLGLSKNVMSTISTNKVSHLPSTPVYASSPTGTTYTGEHTDYDAYVKYLLPGSAVMYETPRTPDYNLPGSGGFVHDQNLVQENKHLVINLHKLKSGIVPELRLDTQVEAKDTSVVNNQQQSKKQNQYQMDKENKLRKHNFQNLNKVSGPVVKSRSPEVDDSEGELSNFRLQGLKPALLVTDATTELILSNKETGQLIRAAEAQRAHLKSLQSPVKIQRDKNTTLQEKLDQKVHGAMSLSSLMVLYKAYQEREKAETAAVRAEKVLRWRQEKLLAKDRIGQFHEMRRAHWLKGRNDLDTQLFQEKESQSLRRDKVLEELNQQRHQESSLRQRLKADQSFVQSFVCHTASISNTLKRHEKLALKENTKRHNQDYVTNVKKRLHEQHDSVNKFLEQRRLTRLAEITKTKADLKKQIIADNHQKLVEASSRVARIKAEETGLYAIISPEAYRSHLFFSSAPTERSLVEAYSLDVSSSDTKRQLGLYG